MKALVDELEVISVGLRQPRLGVAESALVLEAPLTLRLQVPVVSAAAAGRVDAHLRFYRRLLDEGCSVAQHWPH